MIVVLHHPLSNLLTSHFNFFREVFKAKDKQTNKKFVAMKKVLMDNEKEGVSRVYKETILFRIKTFLSSLNNSLAEDGGSMFI